MNAPLELSDGMKTLLVAALLPVATAAWFAYFTRKGWAGARSRSALLALVFGFLAAPLAMLGFGLTDSFGLVANWDTLAYGRAAESLQLAVLIGLVEESAKFLPVLVLVAFRSGPLRPLRVALWSALVGVGFAGAENASLLWNGELSLQDGVARMLASPATHALFAAPWGLGLGAFMVRRTYGSVVLGGAVSVMTHALYDLVLARREIPHAAALAVVIALWAWFIVRSAPKFQPVKAKAARLRAQVPQPMPRSMRAGALLSARDLKPRSFEAIALEG